MLIVLLLWFIILFFISVFVFGIYNIAKSPKVRCRNYKQYGKARASIIAYSYFRPILFYDVLNFYDEFIFIKRFFTMQLIKKDDIISITPNKNMKCFFLQVYEIKYRKKNFKDKVSYWLTNKQVKFIEEYMK